MRGVSGEGMLFNPLAPCGARPPVSSTTLIFCCVFNPLAPCGARRNLQLTITSGYDFSIHSPLAGRDVTPVYIRDSHIHFSIHSPLAGRDHLILHPFGLARVFQSTRPSRGETNERAYRHEYLGISIHSPLAGRDIVQFHRRKDGGISIHSPLAGRDPSFLTVNSHVPGFQSTRPSRGETSGLSSKFAVSSLISIHSPLAGRDYVCPVLFWWNSRFQSTRPSRGETRPSPGWPMQPIFQSTRPSRGETIARGGDSAIRSISIHSPLAGRD